MIAIDNLAAADVLHALEFLPLCRSRRHVRPAAYFVSAHGCVEGLACGECATYWLTEAESRLADGRPVWCRDCLRPFHRTADFYSQVVAL